MEDDRTIPAIDDEEDQNIIRPSKKSKKKMSSLMLGMWIVFWICFAILLLAGVVWFSTGI